MAELADRWYAAWNAKALDKILALYADDVEFASPLVAQLRAGSDGVIRSKGELTEYFRNALERSADMKFKPVAECKGVRGATLIYVNQRDQLVAEQHVLDEAGLIARADVSYAPLPKEVKVNPWKL